jgi:NAD(P) transhydrogenase subunit alpha
MVKDMKPGSVIVDLAVEQGGNCALSEVGKVVTKYGVTIIGKVNVPSLLSVHASQLYARNLANLLFHLFPKQDAILNLEDEITSSSLVTHEGKVRYPPT